jgi:hypothetical protein
MDKIYRVQKVFYGTVDIKASTREEAFEIAKTYGNRAYQIPDDDLEEDDYEIIDEWHEDD